MRLRTPRRAERVFVIQHPDNPTMFFRDAGVGVDWTPNLADARRYRMPSFALRVIVKRLNGRGAVLPLVEPIFRRAA